MINKKKKAIRTTVYMSEKEKHMLEYMSKSSEKNQSEIVRKALVHYLHSEEFYNISNIQKQIDEKMKTYIDYQLKENN